MMRLGKTVRTLVAFLSIMIFSSALSQAAQLKVGVARSDITPKGAVPLSGQFHLRISQGVATPITANALAISAHEDGNLVDSVIFVSVDVVGLPTAFADLVREKVTARDPSIAPEKIVMFAIHTHTSVSLSVGPELPKQEGLEDYQETIEYTADKVAEATVVAWQRRVDADFSWGIDQIVVGESRRSVYFDGTAQMYGRENLENFSHFENGYDPDMTTLFFWDKSGRLIGMMVNLACTSQVVEHQRTIDADYWHPTRQKLNERFGKDVVILGCNAAAGDNSPHPQYRKEALERMRQLRGLSQMDEIAGKIDRGVADTYDAVIKDKKSDVTFGHLSEISPLEMRTVTKEEYEESLTKKAEFEGKLAANPDKTPAEVAYMGTGWYGNVIERYETQQASGQPGAFPANLHVIRLGDIAVATNQFELFTDYGMRIKRRSPAMATMIVELSDGDNSYLPTERAMVGGGYSAVIQSDIVSPAGGQQFVEETLKLIDTLWK